MVLGPLAVRDGRVDHWRWHAKRRTVVMAREHSAQLGRARRLGEIEETSMSIYANDVLRSGCVR